MFLFLVSFFKARQPSCLSYAKSCGLPSMVRLSDRLPFRNLSSGDDLIGNGENRASELQKRLKVYTAALEGERDLKHGREVFTKTCLNCHKLGAEGHEVGPALGSVINKPDEAILVDISFECILGS